MIAHKFFPLVGVAGVLAIGLTAASGGSQAVALADPEQRLELEIVNDSDQDIDLRAYMSTDKGKGWTRGQEHSGLPALPSDKFTSESGKSKTYSVFFTGERGFEGMGQRITEFENFMNMQAESTFTSEKSQTTLSHKGKVYVEDASKNITVKADPANSDDFDFSLQEAGNPAPGFHKKYRLSVSSDPVNDGRASPFGPDAKRLTSSGRAVYKVTVPERTQKLASVPSDLKISPYTVIGRGPHSSTSEEIGKVVPVGKPRVDHAAKTLTVPKATFFFEYPEGYFPQYFLTVLDEFGTGGTTELSRAPGPPAGLDQSAITAVSAAPATGEAVAANGVAQEALKLKLTASGETVGPDHRPELNALYDHLYFRDGNGKLITGMYEGTSSGGYSTVSDVKGAYVNELGGMQQSSAENNRAYLSTTKRTATTLRAELNVSKLQQSPEARVERGDASDTVQGTASQGVSLTKGIADPAIGAYHHYNGEKPEASLITRYGATAAPSTLPLKNPYGGYLAPENGGSIAKLNQPDLFAPTAHVQTQLVNSVGTYVSSPTLATS